MTVGTSVHDCVWLGPIYLFLLLFLLLWETVRVSSLPLAWFISPCLPSFWPSEWYPSFTPFLYLTFFLCLTLQHCCHWHGYYWNRPWDVPARSFFKVPNSLYPCWHLLFSVLLFWSPQGACRMLFPWQVMTRDWISATCIGTMQSFFFFFFLILGNWRYECKVFLFCVLFFIYSIYLFFWLPWVILGALQIVDLQSLLQRVPCLITACELLVVACGI